MSRCTFPMLQQLVQALHREASTILTAAASVCVPSSPPPATAAHPGCVSTLQLRSNSLALLQHFSFAPPRFAEHWKEDMELLNFLQATNGAFKSDLMKSFVAKYKEDPSLHSPVVSGGGGGGGASLFSPQATPGASTDTTGTDTTDNANILFKGSRPDNLQTADTTTTTTASPQLIQQFEDNANTESNQNVIANRPTSATTTTTTTTSPTTTTTTTASGDTNANVGANVPDAGAVLEQLRGALSESRQLLLQQVTDATVEAHLSTCINTQAAVSQALARFRERRDSDQLVSSCLHC